MHLAESVRNLDEVTVDDRRAALDLDMISTEVTVDDRRAALDLDMISTKEARE